MNKKIVLGAVLFLIILGAGYITYNKNYSNKDTSQATGILAKILKQGEVVVGMDATYAPLEYKDSQGNYVGMDVDFSKEIAKDLGVKLIIKDIPWDNLFDAIKNGDIDMSVSSITITAERAKTLGFSDPYFNAGQVIVSTTDKISLIKGPEDLKNLKVGAQINTTSDVEAKKYVANPKNIFNFEQYSTAKDQLLTGKIDAIIIDYPAGVSLAASNQKLAIMGNIFTQEFYGVATDKNQTDLLLRMNKIIRTLKQNGILKQLEDKWIK